MSSLHPRDQRAYEERAGADISGDLCSAMFAIGQKLPYAPAERGPKWDEDEFGRLHDTTHV